MTSRRRGRGLSQEEIALWQLATRGDTRFQPAAVVLPDPPPLRRHDPAPTEIDAPSSPTSTRAGPGGRALDAALENRLRRGRLPIEGSIDLHGLTLRDAEDRLARYLLGAHARGKRCILVITGKGAPPPEPHERDFMPERPRPGAIRAALPRWLNEGPAAANVLAFHPAQPQHGGGGAFYVLLRRRRV